MEKKRRPLRAAMAACGGIADLTIDAALRTGEFEVVAVQDPDPAALRRVGDRHGIDRCHATFEDLIAEDIDFVVINSPNHVHLEQVRLAARAGVPCLVQKPMAPTLADAEAMVRVAAEAKLRLGVTMFELSKPLHHQIREMVAAGWLGTPTLIQAVSAHDIYLKNPPPEGNWRRDPAKVGGGAFIQLAVHQVNLARWILGREVASVTAETTRGHTVFEDETTVATIRFEGGPLAGFTASYAASLYGFSILGTRGRIHLFPERVVLQGSETFQGEIFDYRQPGREAVVEIADLAARIEEREPTLEVHGAFARWLRGESDFVCTGENALQDMQVVDAVYRSVKEGRCVTL